MHDRLIPDVEKKLRLGESSAASPERPFGPLVWVITR
jgi:hypothetical protein